MSDPREEAFSKIEELVSKFHGQFIEKNTSNIEDPRKLTLILSRVEKICRTLNAFLNVCLNVEGNPDDTQSSEGRSVCTDHQIQEIVEENMGTMDLTDNPDTVALDDTDKQDMVALLTELNSYMEWNTDMNSRFGALIARISCYPLSPKSDHRVDGAEPKQEQEQEPQT
jgi:hypothetical protein